MLPPQQPTAPPELVVDPPPQPPLQQLAEHLHALGWIDLTALGVLLVFFALGVFKGLIWQLSRIGILVVAYLVAGRYGHQVAQRLAPHSGPQPTAAQPAVTSGPQPMPRALPGEVPSPGNGAPLPFAPDQQLPIESPAIDSPAIAPSETMLYLAYVLLFVGVLIALSFATIIVKRLADSAGLGFFDRLGGGLLGIATGACVVLAGVFLVEMFFPRSQIALAAETSHSLRLSRRAIDWLGHAVHDDLRQVLALQPLAAATQHPGAPGDAAPPSPTGPAPAAFAPQAPFPALDPPHTAPTVPPSGLPRDASGQRPLLPGVR